MKNDNRCYESKNFDIGIRASVNFKKGNICYGKYRVLVSGR